MGASLADVTDVLRKQIEASAELAVEMKAQTRLLNSMVELLEEIRDGGEMEAADDHDDDEDGDNRNAGLDGVVDGIANQIRESIRAKGLNGLLNRKKKTNGQAPKEVRPTTTGSE